MKKCYQCERENPDEQAFCGGCGSPLILSDYLSKKIAEQLSSTIKDRSVVETESAIRIFERAWGWVKIVGSIAAVLLAIIGAGVFWKVSDFWSGVNNAKKTVVETANSAKGQIDSSSKQSLNEIKKASATATDAASDASSSIKVQTRRISQFTSQTRSEITKNAESVRIDVGKTRTELEAVKGLQPEILNIREGLTKATSEIAVQQKVLSNSAEFVKQIFSSHVAAVFDLKSTPKGDYLVIPPPPSGDRTILLILLPSVPIKNTIQLQYYMATEPVNSYFTIHNLLVFSWADPPDNLMLHPLTVSYFPDATDKELIHSLSEHDGHIFANDQLMPKFNQIDPSFHGNKWLKLDETKTKYIIQ